MAVLMATQFDLLNQASGKPTLLILTMILNRWAGNIRFLLLVL